MSITFTVDTEDAPFLPHEDARLPFAIWYAAGNFSGDASGGNLVVEITLRASASQQRIGNYWSLERLNLEARVVTDHFMLLQGFWRFGGTGVTEPNLPIELRQSRAGSAVLDNAGIVDLPVFLGGNATFNDRQIIQFNQLNGATEFTRFFIMGYRWDSSVRQLPGGPQRPPGAVFGQ